jgi:CRP-like cAMP-binding protein
MRPFGQSENLLARKLSRFVELSGDDRLALDRLWSGSRQIAAAQQDIVREGDPQIREGDPQRRTRLILQGWACGYRMLQDGRRQILGFFLPGDFCDLHISVLRRMDHSVLALNHVHYVALTMGDLELLTSRHPALLKAFWREMLVNASIQREWTVNLGQRSAIERLAHLLCEAYVRLRAVGMVLGNRCEWPITQLELADMLGMTAVHVSRTLKQLRARNLIRLENRQLEILDFDELREIAMFDPDYLHLDCEAAHLDAVA